MARPVIIEPYNPHWPIFFSELGVALRHALGQTALRIDHIGSTSIPGLDAKPVIDIQISVADFEPMEPYRRPLQRLGYEFRVRNPELTKRYFRETPGDREIHIHVRRAGSFSEQFPLLFRDFLRGHPDDAARYAALKHQLAQQYRNDRQAYTEAKSEFIWTIITKADRWAQDSGWQPGPSDA